MSESVYAVIAYIARYWFALLAVVIIWRAVLWLRQDAERVSRFRRRLPDAGFIGEWAVVASEAEAAPVSMVLRAPRDGWIGGARACDVFLPDAGVPARAARFFLKRDGLHVQPQRSDYILVDGEPVKYEAVLRHGATLTAGGVTLQLRLFAGVLLDGETPAVQDNRRVLLPVGPAPCGDDETEPEAPDDIPAEDPALADTIPNIIVRTPGVQPAVPGATPSARPHIELPSPALTVPRRAGRRR